MAKIIDSIHEASKDPRRAQEIASKSSIALIEGGSSKAVGRWQDFFVDLRNYLSHLGWLAVPERDGRHFC